MEINAAALWLNTTFASFDLGVARAVHSLAEAAEGFFTPFFNFVSLLGKYGIFLIIVALLLTIYKPTRRFGTAMCFGLAIGTLLTNCVFKVLVARPRPFADEASEYYRIWQSVGMALEHDKSFPSGHMTAASSSAVALFLSSRKKKTGWLFLLFAVLMGISRIYLGVHYTTDVIGGFLVGTLSAVIGYIITNHLPDAYYAADLPPAGLLKGIAGKKKGGKHCR